MSYVSAPLLEGHLSGNDLLPHFLTKLAIQNILFDKTFFTYVVVPWCKRLEIAIYCKHKF